VYIPLCRGREKGNDNEWMSKYAFLWIRSTQPPYNSIWYTWVDIRHIVLTGGWGGHDSDKRPQATCLHKVSRRCKNARIIDINQRTGGNPSHGEISKVRLEAIGLGMRKVRKANLPPNMSERALRVALGKYGEVRGIQEENWSRAYRYPVANGIRLAMLTLVQHILPHIIVAGHRTLISYEGQPTTCYGWNDTGHLYQVCPHRTRAKEPEKTITTSWAHVAAKWLLQPHASSEEMEVGTRTAEPADLEPQPAEGHSTTPQRGGPFRAGEGHDQTPEAMQIFALNGEDTSNVTHTTTLRESAVDDNMDGEGDAVRAKEKTVEGQTSALRRTKGGKSNPSKREEMENREDKHGRGKGWAQSANTVGGRHTSDGATV